MNALGEKLKATIAAAGPITVADYMALALGDPEHGYYTTRNAIGLSGDFITAPEISQMFGELVGLWCLAAWDAIGRPERVLLVELGPGHGTLMADLIRAASLRPAFLKAAEIHLVEISPELREKQRRRLAPLAAPSWHRRIEDLPEGPAIIVANEFFDALPLRQFVKAGGAWRERLVGLDEAGALAFGLAADAAPPGLSPPDAEGAPDGAVFEINRPAEAAAAALAHRLAKSGGAALIFDYGYAEEGLGDTLQAVRAHRYAEVLADPGECDLTAHVNFAALARAAAAGGGKVLGPVTQGDFLIAMGLIERAGALGADKDAAAQADIVAAVERLAGPEEMGTLFKAMAICGVAMSLPGFGGE